MPLARFRRSTAARIAVSFLTMFVILFVAAALATYLLARKELLEHAEDLVEGDAASIARSYTPDRRQAWIDDVARLSRLRDPERMVLFLQDADGTRLAGNIDRLSARKGLFDDELPQIERSEPEDRFGYRLFGRPVGEMLLITGRDLQQEAELIESIMVAFGWSLLVAIVLALIGGLILSGLIQRRLDAVSDTMDRVADGELTARIPLVGGGDDLDRLSGEVNIALDRLLVLIDGIRQISTDIAHDLKTPLNRLLVSVEEAREKVAQGKPIERELDEVQEEGRHLNRTFDALLRVAQIEAGARRSRFALVDLVDVVANVADAYTEVAVDAGMRLEIDALEATTVTGDRDLLTQLLVNLIENALRHCAEGTTIQVTVNGDRRLIVADDGPGVPADEIGKITRRLYRVEKSRTTLGSGLGLALVKAIAELHGAALSLSDNDPGLRVEVAFPAALKDTA